MKTSFALLFDQGSFEMCYEMCGPPIGGSAEDMADYDAWLESLYPQEDDVEDAMIASYEEEEDETSNTISERDAHQRFDEFLDEIHGTVLCGQLEWDMSRVLKEMDPTAYRCGLNDWLDSEGLELE